MALSKYLERVERIDYLIRRKSTGNPKALAAKLGLSQRSLYVLINEMKDFGAPIAYCKSRESYVYTRQVRFKVGFKEIA